MATEELIKEVYPDLELEDSHRKQNQSIKIEGK